MWWLLVSIATAGTCTVPTGKTALELSLSQGEAAWASGDETGVLLAANITRATLECLGEPLSPLEAGRAHLALALGDLVRNSGAAGDRLRAAWHAAEVADAREAESSAPDTSASATHVRDEVAAARSGSDGGSSPSPEPEPGGASVEAAQATFDTLSCEAPDESTPASAVDRFRRVVAASETLCPLAQRAWKDPSSPATSAPRLPRPFLAAPRVNGEALRTPPADEPWIFQRVRGDRSLTTVYLEAASAGPGAPGARQRELRYLPLATVLGAGAGAALVTSATSLVAAGRVRATWSTAEQEQSGSAATQIARARVNDALTAGGLTTGALAVVLGGLALGASF